MSTPSAYEYGQQFGNARNQASTDSSDRNAMDRILQQVSASKTPQEYDTAIRGIFREISPARQGTALEYLSNQRKQSNENALFDSLNNSLGVTQNPTQFNENRQAPQQPIPFGNENRPSPEPGMNPQANGNEPPGVNPVTQKVATGITPQQVLAATKVNPALGNAVGHIYQGQEKKEAQNQKERFQRSKEAEPELLKISDKLSTLKNEEMHFDRLNTLFSPELQDKFPPAGLVALFTKNGELSAFGQSQLSPEAQEAVKLITDQIKGAKDTFGARVTNFDAQTFLKTLPNLLNSPDGRRRVLRDLKMINEINQMEEQGILDVIDRNGGPENISVSKAKRIFSKEFEPKRKELAQEFANPEKKEFNAPPNPANYNGKRLQDEHGKIFISNGKEWVPQEA